MAFLDATWRIEAWCPEHRKRYAITKIRSSSVLRLVGKLQTFQASVLLECGHGVSIVTTGENLAAVTA